MVDLAGTVATGYCAKLFAEHGATVINVEAPGRGHPMRHVPPFKEGVAAPEASGLYTYLNVHKRSVTLDLEDPDQRPALAALCRRAHALLLGPGTGSSAVGPLSLQEARALAPEAVVAALTWFGVDGPYAGYACNDAVIHSLAGLVYAIGPAEGPPLLPNGYQAQVVGGLTAFSLLAAQLLARRLGNAAGGTWLDLSLFEANLCFGETGTVSVYNLGELSPRLGINRYRPTYPAGVYRCRDGWVGVTALIPRQWQSLCDLLGLPELGRDPRYQTALERQDAADHLDTLIGPRLLERTAAEWFHAGQKARVPLALVPRLEELFRLEQFTSRGTFEEVHHPDQGSFPMPGTAFRLQRSGPRRGGTAPRLGADNAVLDPPPGTAARPWRRPPSPLPPASGNAETGTPATAQGLLAGIRVVDLSMGWAGPLAARHLADMGAQVLKVEACQHFDWWRGWEATPEMVRDNEVEKSSAFNTMNRNKLGLTLDLTQERGRDLLKRLVAVSHVVVENFAASVLPKLGLDYPELVRVNPDLVMISMPPFGASGPWKNYRAYGSTVEHASGLPHLHGEPHWPPTMQHVALGDPVAGLNAIAALLIALWHRAESGRGQWIDLSQVEALFPLGAHGFASQSLCKVPPPRHGSRHPHCAPHGVYPCRGEDRWLTLTVLSEEQWRALCRALDRPDWVQDPRFRDAAARKANEEALDRLVAQWTRNQDRDTAMARLQALAVPSAAVHHVGELLNDAQLRARGFWQWLERDFVGNQPNPSPPYREAGARPRIESPAPTLGQHNHRVLKELLRLDEEELRELQELAVIGTEPSLEDA